MILYSELVSKNGGTPKMDVYNGKSVMIETDRDTINIFLMI